MSFLEINCPRCSSHRVEQADAVHYRCLHCQSFFMRDGAPPPMPPPAPAPVPVTSFTGPGVRIPVQRRTNSGALIGVLIAVGLVVGIVIIAVVGAAVSSARRARNLEPIPTATFEPVSTVTPSLVGQPTGPAPHSRIKSFKKGETINGDPFWILLYENTGESPIGNASARVSAFDGAGHRLDEASGFAVNKNLLPKKTTPVLILGKKILSAKEELEAQTPELPSSYDAGQLEMTVTDFTARKDHTLTDIVGTVKNGTTQSVRFIHVVAVGLDARGDTVSYADTFASAKELAPGATSGFKVNSGTFEISPPVRYQLFSVAMPLK
jgi:hypothetical protein